MNIFKHNQMAWNRQSLAGGEWSTPVDHTVIEQARQGRWEVLLTPKQPVPNEWFGDIKGKRILCLASGGGQQAVVFAAAGAVIMSFDASTEQLAKDQQLAKQHQLPVQCVLGNMVDMSVFPDASFDLIFNPISNVFVPDVMPIWRECFRVLKPGGKLLSGFMNPAFYLFDHEDAEKSGVLTVKYRQPYSDLQSLATEKKQQFIRNGCALEFGHSLASQIGGQLVAGFMLVAFYEDWWSDEATVLNRFMPTSMATKAMKPDENPNVA